MLILFFIVGIGLFVSAILVYTKTHRGYENPYSYIGIVLGTLIMLASFVTIIVGSVYISKSRTINDKIAMYEEENTRIESSVTQAVEKYLEHEQNIFDDLQGADISTLLVVYPEINGNDLVKKQIEIYVSNNDKVRKLKNDKLNIDVWRFWVYFGK